MPVIVIKIFARKKAARNEIIPKKTSLKRFDLAMPPITKFC